MFCNLTEFLDIVCTKNSQRLSVVDAVSLLVMSLTPSGVFTEKLKPCFPVKRSTVMSSAFLRGRSSPMVITLSV